MSRPKMPRIIYKVNDPMVTLDENSMKIILDTMKEKSLIKSQVAKITGVTPDKVRHFIDRKKCRLSDLNKIITGLEIKVILEEMPND